MGSGWLYAEKAVPVDRAGAAENGAILSFQELLEDLLGWNWENQQIQRKWARTIFGTKQTEKGEENDAD